MAWSKPLSGFASQVERDQNKRLRAAALQALSGVIERSPVDSGAFRGNHRISIGSPDNAYDESISDPSGSQAQAEGLRIIGRITKPFDVIYVQNNLPYAERLEFGDSKQAPFGVYAITFEQIKNAADYQRLIEGRG